jgi:pimeloyl-ACP methyl ester carboxylesterase
VTDGQPHVAVDTFVREQAGGYAFPVAPGRYLVGAYEDANQNGLLDPGERAREPWVDPVLEVGPGATATRDILLTKGATTPPELTESLDVFDLVARTPREQQHFSLWAWTVQGALCEELADPRFGAESGRRGLWEVVDFLNEGLAGIYFLEPFDRARVPVLFVHGISGYPQEFTTLMGSLDRKRFQPWFYFYPSGFSLDGISSHLSVLLERLSVERDLDELAIVAHSMGGLVARAALLELWQETGRDNTHLFVTISTPWGGSESAESAESAPVALPLSFSDMDPKSEYLRLLFYEDEARSRIRRLPPSTEFHMLFGYRMSGRSKRANDGSVSVKSQARLEAQEQAASVRALNYRHVTILRSPEVVARLNLLLAERFQ